MASLVLFQGNTRSAIEHMVSQQTLLGKYESKGDKHYLGDGFYFYEDFFQALVWVKMKVTRNMKYLGQPWGVMKCEIEFDENSFADLDEREEQNFFFAEMVRLRREIASNNLVIAEYSDAYLCNHLSKILDLSILAKTFVYRDKHNSFPTLFSNDRSQPYSITRHFRTERQYVVKNRTAGWEIKPLELMESGVEKMSREVRGR
ncbi:MAG TPA: hypothetical protein VFV52_17770 [Bacilli bacterium]|nr:hypothetical protein [Bacilli bacterium]